MSINVNLFINNEQGISQVVAISNGVINQENKRNFSKDSFIKVSQITKYIEFNDIAIFKLPHDIKVVGFEPFLADWIYMPTNLGTLYANIRDNKYVYIKCGYDSKLKDSSNSRLSGIYGTVEYRKVLNIAEDIIALKDIDGEMVNIPTVILYHAVVGLADVLLIKSLSDGYSVDTSDIKIPKGVIRLLLPGDHNLYEIVIKDPALMGTPSLTPKLNVKLLTKVGLGGRLLSKLEEILVDILVNRI